MESLRNSLPVFCHLDHGSCIQDPVAKQVVELQPDAVPAPPVNLIVELVPLGGQHCQVLHVPPRQIQAVEEQHEEQT